MVESAAANAKHLHNIEASDLFIKEIRVDQGPMYRYFKPGAMGRANIYRKRFCHMEVVLEQTTEKRYSMGQKVNPIGFSLGVYRDWNARWFARGNHMVEQVLEDIDIRNFLNRA